MNLNFCVKWLRQIASGADKISDCRSQIADCWQQLLAANLFQSAIVNLKSAIK
jgi:hypothetical protein